MALRQDSFGELKVPLAWTAGVALVVCVVIAVALMLSDRRGAVENTAHSATQQAVDTVVAPVGDVLSRPGLWLNDAGAFIASYWNAAGENRRLKQELEEARRIEDRATALAIENARLRTMLNVSTEPPMPMVTARVVFDGRGPYRRAQLANVGTSKGVAIGHPVISERGLVGRVIGVSPGVSRILMLKDVSARTPVMLVNSNARAILAGDGGDNPRLDNLRGPDEIKAGDRVLTSGDGGIYPRGLPVGRVVKGIDGKWRVALDSDAAPIDWVRILLFNDYSQLADQKALAQTAMPPVITENPQARILRQPSAAPATAPAPKTAPPAAPPAPKTPAQKAPAPKTPTPKTPAAPQPKAAPSVAGPTTPGAAPANPSTGGGQP
ncbi:MAG: rod shape-determining protein MreC [Caulobacter sp.]